MGFASGGIAILPVLILPAAATFAGTWILTARVFGRSAREALSMGVRAGLCTGAALALLALPSCLG